MTENPSDLFTTEGVYANDFELACPVCQAVWTHSIGACTRIGDDPYEAGNAYIGTEAVGVTASRRSALVVMFYCESGHRFALVIQQQKGVNVCSVERLLDRPPTTDEDSAFAAYLDTGRRLAQERIHANAAEAIRRKQRASPDASETTR